MNLRPWASAPWKSVILELQNSRSVETDGGIPESVTSQRGGFLGPPEPGLSLQGGVCVDSELASSQVGLLQLMPCTGPPGWGASPATA